MTKEREREREREREGGEGGEGSAARGNRHLRGNLKHPQDCTPEISHATRPGGGGGKIRLEFVFILLLSNPAILNYQTSHAFKVSMT